MIKIKIGLIGYGRAGKAVAKVLEANPSFTLEWIFRRNVHTKEMPHRALHTSEDISLAELIDRCPVDFIVDFSAPESIFSYGKSAADKGVKIVSAISNYSESQIDYLKELSTRTVVFWSANITLGVNFLIVAAKFLQQIAPDTDIRILEEHFREKKDISGTAIKIAKALDIPSEDINSIRAGGIVGKHQVIFGFPYQTVRIIHESITREAFGSGATYAIKGLMDNGSEKGFFTFEDILLPFFSLDKK